MAVVTADHRRLAIPLVVLGPPPLFLLSRELWTCLALAACRPVALAVDVGFALLALAGAVLVARAVGAHRAPAWLAPRPDDRTLAALAVIVGGLAVYLAAAALGVVPWWIDDLLAPVGVLLVLPLAVVHAVLVGSARSLGRLPPAVEPAAVAVGIALSGAWWYVLAKSAAHGLSRVDQPRD